MNQQLKKILHGENLESEESATILKELIEKYPYFQSARILYAKSLNERQSIHAGDALKQAAAYASDRTVLRNIISGSNGDVAKPVAPAIKFQPIQEEEPRIEFVQRTVETPVAQSVQPVPDIFESRSSGTPSVEELIEPKRQTEPVFYQTPVAPRPVEAAEQKEEKTEEITIEYIKEDKLFDVFTEQEAEPVTEEKQITRNPHDIIRQRLSEILEGSPTTQPSTEEPTPVSQQEVEPTRETVPQKEEEPEEIIMQEVAKAQDVLDTMEIEYAMEESILASLEKLPVIAPPDEKKEKQIIPVPDFTNIKEKQEAALSKETVGLDEVTAGTSASFTGWLKKISPKPFSQFEEVHSRIISSKAVSSNEGIDSASPLNNEVNDEVSDDELIDHFIETDPRIVPSKSEFYSPLAQAKKSSMEHEDVVSETLANIYFEQGNYAKARWCYEKLSLLIPEKSRYFAALLEKAKEAEAKGNT